MAPPTVTPTYIRTVKPLGGSAKVQSVGEGLSAGIEGHTLPVELEREVAPSPVAPREEGSVIRVS